MPPRAATIALATAYQESKIRNIEHGDRDSLGLFQQRPSQGWGTREQILNPYYATNAFYDALVEDRRLRVDADHRGRAAGAALRVPGGLRGPRGRRPGAGVGADRPVPGRPFNCVVRHTADDETDRLDDAGLTTRAAGVRQDLEAAFGDLSLGGFAPGGVRDGHMKGSAHYEGRALDVFVRPIGEGQPRQGLGDGALPGRAGRTARHRPRHLRRADLVRRPPLRGRLARLRPGQHRRQGEGTVAVLEHRDHVHVDVLD